MMIYNDNDTNDDDDEEEEAAANHKDTWNLMSAPYDTSMGWVWA
jgi:hypothetical protein